MKLSSLAVSAMLALCAISAHASSTSVSVADEETVTAMPAAEPGTLVTRVSDDGKVMQIQNADGSFSNLAVTQASDDVVTVSDGKEVGQFIASSDAQASGVQLAWWGGWHHWHHHDWGHFGWHRHGWYPRRHFYYGGWHWHHWHRGW